MKGRQLVTTLSTTSETITFGTVFLAFDRLRRQLAVEMHGDAGAFTGFTQLTTHADALRAQDLPGEISVSATVTGESSRSTRVEYVAFYSCPTETGGFTNVVAQGTGVTVHPREPRLLDGMAAEVRQIVGLRG